MIKLEIKGGETVRLSAPDIFPMDAVGNFCLDWADCLGNAGYAVELYAENFPPYLSGRIKKTSHLFSDVRPNDLVFVSYSIFDPLLNELVTLSNPKICYFHGVTPSELLQEFDPITADLCRRSISQFAQLAHFDIVMANSRFTAKYLEPFMPSHQIEIAPPVFPSRMMINDGGGAVAKEVDGPTLLFVGRVVPHKKIEELLDVLAELRRVDSSARLVVIGECSNHVYLEFLRKHIVDLGIPGDKVVLAGKVTDAELALHYSSADAFLCMSLHEGFCIPVLEAMGFGLPVFVREGNAAVEVAGDAGMHFSGDDCTAIAKLISRTLADREQRMDMILRGHLRYNDLLQMNTPEFWGAMCERVFQRVC